MSSIIEDLYYGNIPLSQCCFRRIGDPGKNEREKRHSRLLDYADLQKTLAHTH